MAQADLLSTKQAAERLECSVSTLSRMVARGDLIPALRLDGQTGAMWFHAADVDALAAPEKETAKP